MDVHATPTWYNLLGGGGGGVLSQFLSFRYFPYFSIVNTHVSYWISRLYLKGVAAAELRQHLSNRDVSKNNRYFCEIENFAYGEINERGLCAENVHIRGLPLVSTVPVDDIAPSGTMPLALHNADDKFTHAFPN